jgi:transposase
VTKYLKTLEETLKSESGIDEPEFVTAYEAGCLGFSLYKDLAKLGIRWRIIAPTTLVRSADSGMKKSDRKDARMLAWSLAFGACRFVSASPMRSTWRPGNT